jgi:hypothetical protein
MVPKQDTSSPSSDHRRGGSVARPRRNLAHRARPRGGEKTTRNVLSEIGLESGKETVALEPS